MKNRCRYCHREVPEQENYYSIKCKTKGDIYNAYREKFIIPMYVLIVILLLIIFVAILFFDSNLSVISFTMIGLTFIMFIFPFGNSDDLLGIKNSIMLIRITAIILMIFMIFLLSLSLI